MGTTGQNVSASSDGEKSLQDTGFPVIIVFSCLFNFFFPVSGAVVFYFILFYLILSYFILSYFISG